MRICCWRSGACSSDVELVVMAIATSGLFYVAVMAARGVPIGGSATEHFWYDELFVSSHDGPEAQGKLTGRHHLAFQAQDRAMVEAFYKAALEHGGTDNGAPGERPYHPGYYAAFVQIGRAHV